MSESARPSGLERERKRSSMLGCRCLQNCNFNRSVPAFTAAAVLTVTLSCCPQFTFDYIALGIQAKGFIIINDAMLVVKLPLRVLYSYVNLPVFTGGKVLKFFTSVKVSILKCRSTLL